MPSLTLVGPNGQPKIYHFHTLALSELRILQEWIDKNSTSPLKKLVGHLDGLPEVLATRAVDRAIALMETWTPPRVGGPEANAFLQSSSALIEIIRLMLRKGDPGISDDEITLVVAQIDSPDQINTIMRKSTGLSEAIPSKAQSVDGAATLEELSPILTGQPSSVS